MSKGLSETLEFALDSKSIRPLAKRLDRILSEKYDLEGYLTDESGYPQLVLQKGDKAIVLESKQDNQDSDCLWTATTYYEDESRAYVWKRDVVNQILWLISNKKPQKYEVNEPIRTDTTKNEPIRGTKNNMSTGNPTNNKLAYVRDVFDVLFRIMEEESFPKESRMDLITMGVNEFIGLKGFNTIFENIQKKRETNALSSKINQLEELVKQLSASNKPAPGGFTIKKSSGGTRQEIIREDDEDEDEDGELNDFDQELENIEDEE
jgi:hypothetical protein